MAWVRLDDSFPEHPKVVRAGDRAAWLFVCGLTYCSRQLTDGFIPLESVGRLTQLPGERKLAQKLVEVGLWDQLDNGYRVHDYPDYQRTKKQVAEERERSAERMREWRKAHANGR